MRLSTLLKRAGLLLAIGFLMLMVTRQMAGLPMPPPAVAAQASSSSSSSNRDSPGGGQGIQRGRGLDVQERLQQNQRQDHGGSERVEPKQVDDVQGADTASSQHVDIGDREGPPVVAEGDEELCCEHEANVDYLGGDISFSGGETPEDCCVLCKANPECFKWTLAKGMCWLKGAGVQSVTAKPTDNIVSGTVCRKTPPPTPAPPAPPPVSRDTAQASVKAAMQHAWSGYATNCFGKDELHPVKGTCGNWLGAGLTIIDAMSTLHLMGLDAEFDKAAGWVANNLKFDYKQQISMFETTIRILGGLMSAFDFTGNQVFVDKGKELADKMMPVFDTHSGIPWGRVNLMTGQVANQGWSPKASILSEVGTIQLEYFALSRHTHDTIYRQKAQNVIDVLEGMNTAIPGLLPIFLTTNTAPAFTTGRITMGGCGDSYYEYLLKMWLLTGKTNKQYQRMYVESMNAMIQHMVKHAGSETYVAELNGKSSSPNMEHLACFVPGMLALGATSGIVEDPKERARHMDVAKQMTETCYHMYSQSPSGISAESTTFSSSGMRQKDGQYHMRPEVLESIFILWRTTKDERYREMGWAIFEAIEKHCKVPRGYAGLQNVGVASNGAKTDPMESFFLAETLKYLYLLFSPDSTLPLAGVNDAEFPDNLWVFNTEAHPIRVWRE